MSSTTFKRKSQSSSRCWKTVWIRMKSDRRWRLAKNNSRKSFPTDRSLGAASQEGDPKPAPRELRRAELLVKKGGAELPAAVEGNGFKAAKRKDSLRRCWPGSHRTSRGFARFRPCQTQFGFDGAGIRHTKEVDGTRPSLRRPLSLFLRSIRGVFTQRRNRRRLHCPAQYHARRV